MSKTADKIINTNTAGTPVIDMTNLGNHVACPNCINKDQRIADLEAKLAESEKENKRISSGNLSHSIYVDKKIERLEQQLAEKEEQIKMLEEHKFYADNIIQAYADKCKQHNQDKKELLEKVESYIKDSTYIKEPDYTNVCEYIRNLIKEIKGE